MQFPGRTLAYVMLLVSGAILLGLLIVKGPRIPLLISFVAAVMVVPLTGLIRQLVRNRRNNTPAIPPTLPRPVRREMQRRLRKVDRMLRQRQPGFDAQSVRTILDSIEEHIGREIDENDVPKLLVAFEQNRSGRIRTSSHQVA